MAQAPGQPGGLDPLMSLMMSQPRIDVVSEVRATATFDPPAVPLGETAIYRLTFNALEESVELPTEISTPKELELRPSAHGQMLQMAAGSLVPLTSFNHRVRATSIGTFTIPEFVVQVYGKPVKVPAARLDVVESGTAQARRLFLELGATNLYVGQAVPVRVMLPGSSSGAILPMSQVQLTGNGFLVDQGAAGQRIIQVTRNGLSLPTFVHETSITAIESGSLTCMAQGFTSGLQFSGPVVISGQVTLPGGIPSNVLLESEPVQLRARPLPREGELPGFTGAIGDFAIDPPRLATNVVRVGEPVRLSVTVRGASGNLARLVPPSPPRVREWQVLAAAADPTPPQLIQARGYAVFDYTMVPLTEAARATPAIPFSYFDPQTGSYSNLAIPPAAVTVQAGAVPADLKALTQTAEPAGEEPEAKLSGLAAKPGRSMASLRPPQQTSWFALAQLGPGGFFLGLWAWDRRRRYFERHPEILVRRRARRALRRERRAWRQAARDRDAQGFAARAVSAMRVACAPHFPAEPRALVGNDVLQLLDEPDRAGRPGDAVRRVFAVSDESHFAAVRGAQQDLLALEPEVEHLLQRLEEKL